MFEDLMALKERFGATAAELGIDEEFWFSYKTNGKFFDYDCDCYLYFDENKIFTDYDLFVYGDENGRLSSLMDNKYSKPVSSHATPYVASNGGAVYTDIYEDEDAIIAVTKAQNNNYHHISIKPKTNI